MDKKMRVWSIVGERYEVTEGVGIIKNNDMDNRFIVTLDKSDGKPPQNIAFQRRDGSWESQPGWHVEETT